MISLSSENEISHPSVIATSATTYRSSLPPFTYSLASAQPVSSCHALSAREHTQQHPYIEHLPHLPRRSLKQHPVRRMREAAG